MKYSPRKLLKNPLLGKAGKEADGGSARTRPTKDSSDNTPDNTPSNVSGNANPGSDSKNVAPKNTPTNAAPKNAPGDLPKSSPGKNARKNTSRNAGFRNVGFVDSGFALLLLIIGVGAIFWATEIMDGSSASWRIPITLIGILITYWGLDAILKRKYGPDFETGLYLAIGWIVLVLVAAIFADLLPLKDSREVTEEVLFRTETRLRPDLFSRHPLGTDSQGLDILGGVIYGARISLQVGLGAVAIGLAVGGSIGIIAGYFRKSLDTVVGLFTDSFLAFPPLILLLALATVLERSPRNIALALAIVGIPTYIRLARANTLVFAQRDFVLAAKAMGAGHRRILAKEIAPNVILPLISYAFIIIAVLIVAEASLSFLGLGIQRPNPTWGNMIAAGQDDFDKFPHLIFVPGIVMFLTVFSLNRIGEKARSLWDPRASQIN